MCDTQNGWKLEVRKASLKETQLADGQMDIVIYFANHYNDQRLVLAKKAERILTDYSADPAQATKLLSAIQQAESQILETSISDLLVTLGSKAAEKLQEYINNVVKRKIKMHSE